MDGQSEIGAAELLKACSKNTSFFSPGDIRLWSSGGKRIEHYAQQLILYSLPYVRLNYYSVIFIEFLKSIIRTYQTPSQGSMQIMINGPGRSYRTSRNHFVWYYENCDNSNKSTLIIITVSQQGGGGALFLELHQSRLNTLSVCRNCGELIH